MPMTIDALVLHVFGDASQPLALQCECWIRASRRFRAFVEIHDGKIRKKVRAVRDEEAGRDLYCELETAYLLLQARELSVEYEQYAQTKQRGPDFSLTYRTRTHFNVEVKRLRASREDPAARRIQSKLVNSVCDKLTQLPPSVINVLALVGDGQTYAADELGATMTTLKDRAALREDMYFARRGFLSGRDYLKHAQRLSAVLLRASSDSISSCPTVLWSNPEARHPLPRNLASLLLRCTTPQVSSESF
jgi:hypothetical protein